MRVKLGPVTQKNWRQCIKLSIYEYQKGLVATNLYSLAQAKVYPTYLPVVAYDGETMVGFAMYGLNPEDKEYWILRVMVDHEHQGRGYGRAIVKEVLEDLRAKPMCKRVFISYDSHNRVAETLYTSLGFKPTGEVRRTEVIACLNL